MTKLKTKPNGVYYLDTQVPDGDGGLRRARVGLGTKDKDEAEAQRRDWVAGIHPKHPAVGGEIAPKGRSSRPNSSGRSTVDGPTLSHWLYACLDDEEVWGKCRAEETHRSNVRILLRLLPDGIRLREITTAQFKELNRILRDEEGYAPASRRKLMGTLSRAMRHAAENEKVDVMPMVPKVTVKNEKDRVISLDEEAAMFASIMERRRTDPFGKWWHFERLMIILLDTGCRLTEAVLAGPSWVKRKRWTDRATGEVHEGIWLAIPRTTIYNGEEIVVTKNEKPRDIPLTRRALACITELNERCEGVRWFPWAKGSGGPLNHLTRIRADMAERGFEFSDVVLHTCRHTCATRLAEGGMDLVALRDWLGHSDVKVTAKRYLHLMNGHIYPGAAILNSYGSIGSTSGKPEESWNDCSKTDVQPNGTDRAKAVAHV